MGRKLFELLHRITWTRGSGGKILGNDEYNRDDEHEGGGGNYVTMRFGPDVQKRKAESRSIHDTPFLRAWSFR